MKKDSQKEGKFEPRAGQVDYSNIRWAPVLNCVLRHKGNILIIQRGEGMRLYPGYWNGISGFLDDDKSLVEKVYEELREEAGLSEKEILSVKPGQIFDQDEEKYRKTWIVHPVLVEVATDAVKLDWEGARYQWTDVDSALKLDLLPGFDRVLKILLKI